jgi:hypothetical protein
MLTGPRRQYGRFKEVKIPLDCFPIVISILSVIEMRCLYFVVCFRKITALSKTPKISASIRLNALDDFGATNKDN